MLLAAIDIGTVTARLALAQVEDGRVIRMAKYTQIVNLGEGVDKAKRLLPEAIHRCVGCVSSYVDHAKKEGAEAVVCTLTSAARDAENAPDLGMGLASLGLEPMIIPGEIEGALTFLGVSHDFENHRILVADSGGGSTELVVGTLVGQSVAQGTNQQLEDQQLDGQQLDINFVESVDLGCRRLTERFNLSSDHLSAEDIDGAHQMADQMMSEAISRAQKQCAVPELLVGVGGTATSLIAIRDHLDPYDPSKVHLNHISLDEVSQIEGLLASKTLKEREDITGLQAKRAPVMLAGTILLAELMKSSGFKHLVVSESDLLFGLVVTASAVYQGKQSPVIWKPILRPLNEK
ncbi:phosphatase [Lancefieldella parvula]|uniref:Ppx/GppA phosphatase n=1 Tax=Lancefieldella parvula (strain ATCC 33793 / DSM 20469 / CCUG 32760 / JCM 10300 / KCTC 3663 / VPI 0546 / 1246) TaxID=521095 RepID=C8W8X6_LANP1|nr:phosphatase [Lancefieldella parvula]ACV50564.1 Ppx/GppA phosphatase [Lancefieldella parvula DSM 20469]MDU4868883.1 phosphatase [Lancefieldella parvula]